MELILNNPLDTLIVYLYSDFCVFSFYNALVTSEVQNDRN